MAKKNKKSKFVPMTSDNEKRINATTQQRPSLEQPKTSNKRAGDIKITEIGESSSLKVEPIVYTECEQEPLSKNIDDATLDQLPSSQLIKEKDSVKTPRESVRQPNKAVVPTRTSPRVFDILKPAVPDTMNPGWIKTTLPQGIIKPFSNKQQNLNPTLPEFKPRASSDSSQNLVPNASVYPTRETKSSNYVETVLAENHQQSITIGFHVSSEDCIQPSELSRGTTGDAWNTVPHIYQSTAPSDSVSTRDQRRQFNQQRRDSNYARSDRGRNSRNVSYKNQNEPSNKENGVNPIQNRFLNQHTPQGGDRGNYRDRRRSSDYQTRFHNQEKNNFYSNQRHSLDQNQSAQTDGGWDRNQANSEVAVAPTNKTGEIRTPHHAPRNNFNKRDNQGYGSYPRRSLNQQGYHKDRRGGSMRHQRHSTDCNDLENDNNAWVKPYNRHNDGTTRHNQRRSKRNEDEQNVSQDSGESSWADANNQPDGFNNARQTSADQTTWLVDSGTDESYQWAEKDADNVDSSFYSARSHDQQTSEPVDWNDLTDPQEDDLEKADDSCDSWHHQYRAAERGPNIDNWRDRPSNFKDPRMEREGREKKDLVQSRMDRYLTSGDDTDREFRNWEKNWRKIQEFKNIKEVQQDLFTVSKEYSLAHCVAEDMRMGSGIAVQFKRDFKCQAELLQQRAKQGGLAVLEHDGRHIYYLVTKRLSTGKPTYYTMWQSLRKLRDHAVEHRVQKLAVPRLGCGLDRLDWVQVKSMMQHVFDTTDVEVLVCNFQQNDEEQSSPGKTYQTCKQVREPYPITKIESSTIILYFSTQDGDVSEEMTALDQKFNFLPKFNAHRPKPPGGVVMHEDKRLHYLLCGCIVRKTSRDPIDYAQLGKCIVEINKYNRKSGFMFGYVAFQMLSTEDHEDDLIDEKILTILTNYMWKVDVYVCTGKLSDGSEE